MSSTKSIDFGARELARFSFDVHRNLCDFAYVPGSVTNFMIEYRFAP